MASSTFFRVALAALALGVLRVCDAATTVSVSATASHAIPTTLWGQMFEDINSGDGGLYAEMLQNRAFQQVTPGTTAALNSWAAVNGGQISVISDPAPVSANLRNSLQFVKPSAASAGFSNSGFWGIKVDQSWTYTASLYFKFPASSSFTGTLSLSLRSSSGETLASNNVQIRGSQTSWQHVSLPLKPTKSASDNNNLFVVSVDGAAGTTINFAMFSLFPPTFKNRPNGMRIDIAETLVEMGPSFFRFPGGNNLEGQTTATRWQWNTTVGSLLDRPGRSGDWGYVNTDGLGLLEYLTFFEDADMEPIMGVWDGYALGGTSVASGSLQPYIQQAIDQINFVIGDAKTTKEGALRASLGHPAPFKLRYVEIGNEDFIGSAPSTIQYRWQQFADGISAAFPQLGLIATSNTFNPRLTPNPAHYDVHVYQTPTWFYQNAFFYDGFQRNGTTYFEGEYAAISTNPSNLFGNPSQGRLEWPTMQGSSGEAAFMTGLERNSDIVFAAAYAPLLQHVASTQWTPDLISFDAGTVYKSTSFYTQKLFATNRGDEYLPSTLPSRTGTLHWSVSRKTSTQEVIIKIANAAAASEDITFQLPFNNVATSGSLQLLTGAQTASNTPTSPNTVVPKTSTITTGKTINFTAPAFSVSVITVKAS